MGNVHNKGLFFTYKEDKPWRIGIKKQVMRF